MPNDQPELANGDDPEAVVRKLLAQVSEDLEPISPERALELYLEDKARDCRQSTVDSHRSRLGFLVRWCEDQGIENRKPHLLDGSLKKTLEIGKHWSAPPFVTQGLISSVPNFTNQVAAALCLVTTTR